MSSIRLFPDSIINRLLIHTVILRKRTKTDLDAHWGDKKDAFTEYEIKCMFQPWRRGEEIIFELQGVGEIGDARAWFKKEYETDDGTIVVEKEDELYYEGNYYEIKQLYPYIDGTANKMYEARLERVRE